MSEASIVLSAVDKTKGAFDSVRGSVDSVKGSVAGLQGAIVGLGVALGALKFADIIKGGIDSAAGLKQLSEQTGASVEGLSALNSVGKLSETSADSIGNAMNRLAKNMSTATEEGKGAAAALRAIGVDFDTFQKMSPDEKMVALSKALAGFNDGSGKSAVAMALMGKEGAKLLPFMNDLAEVSALQAKVTKEQTDRADDFQKNLIRLKASGEGWKKELALGMLPALDDAATAFLSVVNGTGGLRDEIRKLSADGTIADWTRSAITGLSYVGDAAVGVVRVVQSVGKAFGALWAAQTQVLQGNFRAALDTVKGLGGDIDQIWSEPTMFQRFRAAQDGLQGVARAAAKAKKDINFPGPGEKQGKDPKDPFDTVLKQISERTAAYNAEIDASRKLTEGEKLLAKVVDDIQQGRLKVNETTMVTLDLALKEMLLSEKRAATMEAARKADEEAGKAHLDRIRELDASTAKIREEIGAQLEHNAAVMGGKAAAAELAAAKLEEQAVSLETLAIRRYEKDVDYGVYQLYLDQAAALRELAKAKREGGALDDSVKSFKSVFESVDRTGKDVWNGFWTKGESTLKKLATTAKATILDALYEIAAKPIFVNLVAQMTGTPLAAAQTAAGVTGGGGSSALGAISSIGSMFGAGGLGGSLAAGAGWLTGATSFTGALSAGASLIGTGTAAGAMSGLGMIAGALGPIVGGIALLQSVIGKKGETRHGGQFSGTDLISAPSGGGYEAGVPAIAGTIQSINSLLKQLGSSSQVSGYYSGFEDSKNGKGFAYARGTLSTGANFGNWMTEGYMQNRGSMTSEQAAQAFAVELKRSTIAALQASDLKGALADSIRDLGDAANLTSDQLDAAMNRLNTYSQQKAALDERMFQATATEDQKKAHAREQERNATDAALRSLLDEVYAQEDLKKASDSAAEAIDKAAQASRQIRSNALSAMNDAFGVVQDAASRERDAIDRQYDQAVAPVQDRIDAISESVQRLQATTDLFRGALSRMRNDPVLGLTRGGAQAQLANAMGVLRAGGQVDTEALSQALDVVAQPSQQLYGSFVDYAKAFDKQVSQINELADLSGGQLSTAKRSLQAQQDQLTALTRLRDDSVARLDALVATARDQVAAANGGTVALAQAISLLGNSVTAAKQATAPGGAGAVQLTPDQIRSEFDAAIGASPTISQIYQYAYANRDHVSVDSVAKAYGATPEAAAAWIASQGLPSFDVGTPYVPRDMTANIHRGERILTSSENARLVESMGFMVTLLQEIRAASEATALHTHQSRKRLQEFAEIGIGVKNAPDDPLVVS